MALGRMADTVAVQIWPIPVQLCRVFIPMLSIYVHIYGERLTIDSQSRPPCSQVPSARIASIDAEDVALVHSIVDKYVRTNLHYT
jgi:hypothetical protein